MAEPAWLGVGGLAFCFSWFPVNHSLLVLCGLWVTFRLPVREGWVGACRSARLKPAYLPAWTPACVTRNAPARIIIYLYTLFYLFLPIFLLIKRRRCYSVTALDFQ